MTGQAGLEAQDEAFAIFYREEHATLFRCLLVLTHDRADAEDLAQEAFVRILERWKSVAAMQAPRAYLYRVALNLRRTTLRRAIRQARRALVLREAVDDFSDASVERIRLAEAVKGLSRQQLEALLLTDLVGMTSEEAGAALGASGDAVRARSHRARVLLRKELGEDE